MAHPLLHHRASAQWRKVCTGPSFRQMFFIGLTSSLATGHAALSARAPDNYLWLVADLINIYSSSGTWSALLSWGSIFLLQRTLLA